MNHRPYPNVDRALRQISRHYLDEPVMAMPECLRPMAESFTKLRVHAQRAADMGFGVDEYRLPTR